MAVREVGVIAKRFTGLSTDQKPYVGQEDLRTATAADGAVVASIHVLTGADVPGGSEFLETDTGRTFRWNGSTWIRVTEPEDPVPVLRQIAGTLVDLKDYLMLKLGP